MSIVSPRISDVLRVQTARRAPTIRAPCGSFGFLLSEDGELTVHAIRFKLYFVADLYLLKRRRILHAKHHGMTRFQIEFFHGTVSQRDLSRRLVDPGDLTVDQVGLCTSGIGHRRHDDHNGYCQYTRYRSHGCTPLGCVHFTMTFPIIPASG